MKSFKFSVIRVVPDPVKDEGINVGAIVVSEDGKSGDFLYNSRFRTRVSRLKRDFPYDAALASLRDVATFIGIESQLAFGGKPVNGNLHERLRVAVQNFEGQIQLTEPAPYRAVNLKTAVQEIYQRYVTKRLPSARRVLPPSSAQMKAKIWQTVRTWSEKNLTVEKGGLLRGQNARHHADFVIKNGKPRGAIFALPASEDERAMTFLYRDSLPTIADDMGDDFLILGVLPDGDVGLADKTSEFVAETRKLLDSYARVEVADLSNLEELEDHFVKRLL